MQNKYKEKQPKQIEKPKKVKKGITKWIKMYLFFNFLLFVINFMYKMQKAISNKIQLGDNLNL